MCCIGTSVLGQTASYSTQAITKDLNYFSDWTASELGKNFKKKQLKEFSSPLMKQLAEQMQAGTYQAGLLLKSYKPVPSNETLEKALKLYDGYSRYENITGVYLEKGENVVLAGDLLDSEQIYGETAQLLARALGSMGVPVFLAPGNHDFWSPRSPYARIQWPENVHIFHTAQAEAVPLPRLGCTVYGAAFTAPARADRVLEGFRAEGEGLRLMVLHGSTEPTDRYGPVPAADIAASGLDYLALGHVHTASGLNRTGDTWWAYPGCPEGRGFDETGDKGVYCLEIDKGQVRETFLPLCRRRYVEKEADLAGRPAAEVLDALLPASPDASPREIPGSRRFQSICAEFSTPESRAGNRVRPWPPKRLPLRADAAADSRRLRRPPLYA